MATSNTTICLLLLLASMPAHSATAPAACQGAAQQPAIATAREALQADSNDLRARYKLADAWSGIGCFSDALHVLQEAEAQYPKDAELQARLRVLRSNVSEQSYFENLDRAAQSAKLSHATLRCNQLADLNACDDALQISPNDVALMTAKGDALLQQKRPGESIVVLRRALSMASDKGALTAKLSTAEAQRQALVASCETGDGESARQACQSAWLAGAPDEQRIFKRRGELLQAGNQSSAALDAYMAAARLNPGDKEVAHAIISLSESTGRNDASTLAARTAALKTVGRTSVAARSPAVMTSAQLARDTAMASASPAAANSRRFTNLAEPTRSN